MSYCSICVAQRGLKGSELDERDFSDDDALADHMEDVHGMPVQREYESAMECRKRCEAKGVVEDRNVCKCQDCRGMRGENWRVSHTALWMGL